MLRQISNKLSHIKGCKTSSYSTVCSVFDKGYRFGFNGKEIDKNSEGMGGGVSTYDYGFRIYNPNLGRFLSVDPLSESYPWYTPYQFAGNKPIWCIDLDGLEEQIVSITSDGKKTVLFKMSDYSSRDWRGIQSSFFSGFSHTEKNTSGFNWIGGYIQYTMGMGTSNPSNGQYVGPGKGTLTLTLDACGNVSTVNYNSSKVAGIKGPKQESLTTAAKEGVKATWQLFFASTTDPQIMAMRSDLKKVPVVIAIGLSGGTLGSIIGGTASATTIGVTAVDLTFSIDELFADNTGVTPISAKLTPEQNKYYASFKAAFGVYTKIQASCEWALKPNSMVEFSNWLNENYLMVDGALEAIESVKKAKQAQPSSNSTSQPETPTTPPSP